MPEDPRQEVTVKLVSISSGKKGIGPREQRASRGCCMQPACSSQDHQLGPHHRTLEFQNETVRIHGVHTDC